MQFAKKGYDLLNTKYKKLFVNLYATVLFNSNRKPDAYTLLEDEIAAGNNAYDILKDYFAFYYKDKRYQDGIDKILQGHTDWEQIKTV